jgi:hypothetical protein
MTFLVNAFTHVFEDPLSIIAPAVGIITGNPWLGALAAGGVTAARGGNSAQILGSAATAGLGGFMGKSVGGAIGGAIGGSRILERYPVGSSAAGQILGSMTGEKIGERIGAGLGTAVLQSMQRQQAMRAQNALRTMEESPLPMPSFEEMRSNAVDATRKAFEEKEIYLRPSAGALDAIESSPGETAKNNFSRRNIPRPYLGAIRKSNRPRYGQVWKKLVRQPNYRENN